VADLLVRWRWTYPARCGDAVDGRHATGPQAVR